MLRTRRGFTLIEILVVLAIIGILMGILLPVLSRVREGGRATVCRSNLRQLGQAMTLYTQDYDHYPRARDAADAYTGIWNGRPEATGVGFEQAPLLPDAMNSYVKSRAIWQCPSDIGFDELEMSGEPLPARPTCFQAFGNSYFYRTELTLLNLAEERVPSPTETNVLFDAHGSWHGTGAVNVWSEKRYNMLFADGHVKNVSRDAFDAAWAVRVR